MDKFCVVCEKTTKAPDPDGFYQIGGGVMLCVCLPCRKRVNIGRLVEFEIQTLESKRDKDEPLGDSEEDWLNDLQRLAVGMPDPEVEEGDKCGCMKISCPVCFPGRAE